MRDLALSFGTGRPLRPAWAAAVQRRLRRLPRLPFATSIASGYRGLTRTSMPLVLVGISALSSCDSGAKGRTSSAGMSQGPNLSPEALVAIEADVRKSLRSELRPEVLADLRRELAPAVKAELLAEMRRDPRPPPRLGDSPDTNDDSTPSAAPSGPVTPPTPGEPGKEGDPWSEPGTRIWPSAGGLKLVELVVGTALEDKLPTDVALHYATPPEILYCYTVFENPEPDATVTHVWRRGSRLVSRVELEVGNSPKWRTWSKQRTQPQWTGLWSCEVLDSKGQQLGLTVFQIGG